MSIRRKYKKAKTSKQGENDATIMEIQSVRASMNENVLSESVQQDSLECLAKILSRREGLLRAGAGCVIPSIIAAFRDHSQSKSIVRHAFECLFLLSNDPRGGDLVNVPEMIELLVAAMRNYSSEEHQDLRSNACQTLVNLAVTQATCSMMVDVGAIPLIVQIMNDYRQVVKIQEGGCAVLSNICVLLDDRTMLVESYAIPSIIAAMNTHLTLQAIQTHCCDFIFRLCADDWCEQVVDAQGISAVTAAMKNHSECEDIQSYACGCLHLLASASEDYVSHIMTADAIVLIIDAMNNFPQSLELLQPACGIFATLSSIGEYLLPVPDERIIPLLVETLNNHNEVEMVALAACTALLNLTWDEDNIAKMLDAGAISSIIAAMHIQEDPAVLSPACGALGALAVTPEAKDSIVSDGGIAAVLRSIHIDMADLESEDLAWGEFQDRAVQLITQITEIADEKKRSFDADLLSKVLSELITEMNTHIVVESVQAFGCEVLHHLLEVENCCAAISDAEGISAITAATNMHKKNQKIQELGTELLSRLRPVCEMPCL